MWCSGAYATLDLAFIFVPLSLSLFVPMPLSSRWPLAPEAGSCHLYLFAGGVAQSLAPQCSWDATLPAPDEEPGHPTRPAVSLGPAASRAHAKM